MLHKTHLHILSIMMLSIIIVTMSVGVNMLICLHSGIIQIAQTDSQENHPNVCVTSHCDENTETCCSQDTPCQTMAGHCMRIITVKLSPQQNIQQEQYRFESPATQLLSLFSLLSPQFLVHNEGQQVYHYYHTYYPPPQTVLHILRRLLI